MNNSGSNIASRQGAFIPIGILALLAAVGMAEFLPQTVALLVLLVVFFTGLAVFFFRRENVPAVWLLLPVFYFFPYENINPLVRETAQYFSIYRRIFGPLNVWELLMGATGILLITQRLKRGRFTVRGIPEGPWFFLLMFYLFAFVVGLLHVKGNLLSYGNTDLTRPFVASQVILYMVLIYWITMNSLETPEDIRATVRLLRGISILLVAYGIVRGVLILKGILPTIWPFGLPIIIYNQMVMLYLVVFWGVLYFFERRQPQPMGGFWTVVAVLLILTSTRRFNYFVLVAGMLASVAVAVRFYRLQAKAVWQKIRRPLVGSILALVLVLLIFPNWFEVVGYSFRSFNIFGVNDTITNNDIRRFALSNLFLNMFRRPYTLLTGFGLGTTWQAIVYQPFDTLFLTVNSEFLRRSLGWYPQFPLPYLNAVYRYGIAGTLLYWGLLIWLFRRYFSWLKLNRSPGFPTAFYLAALILMPFFLGLIGDIYNPTGPIFVGLLLAVVERTYELQQSGEDPWPE